MTDWDEPTAIICGLSVTENKQYKDNNLHWIIWCVMAVVLSCVYFRFSSVFLTSSHSTDYIFICPPRTPHCEINPGQSNMLNIPDFKLEPSQHPFAHGRNNPYGHPNNLDILKSVGRGKSLHKLAYKSCHVP